MGVMPEAFSDKVITYSILDWKSFKLTRVARSSLSAETQAAAGAMDMLEFVKVFWNLVEEPETHVMADKLRVQRSSALVVDAKSLYDSVRKETPIQGATDKRAAIEQLVLKEQLKETNSTLRWVSSERQLADGLTKVQARTLFAERLKGQQYKLVFDPAFQAAKKKTLSQRKQSEREGIAVQKVEEVLLISNSFLPQTFGLKTTMPPPRQGSRSRHPSAAMDEAPDYDGDEGPPSRSRSRSASEERQPRSPSKEGKRAKQDDDSDETGRARSETRAPKRQRGERGGQRRGRQVRDRETAQVSSLVIQAPWR